MAEYDKSGWTVYEPALCECIGARIASSRINGSIKPTFILELYDPKLQLTAIKWLGVIKTPKGSYSVKENSDFAKLYRLTVGYVSKSRYSKAQQLLKHFVGCEFIAEFESAKGANGDDYLRVIDIASLNPIITDGWFSDGRIRDKNWKPTGNELEINRKKSGNKLETQKAGKPHLNLASTAISTPLKDITSKIEPYNHVELIPVSSDEYKTTMTVVRGSKNYQYYQRSDEAIDEYHKRVIDESWTCSYEKD